MKRFLDWANRIARPFGPAVQIFTRISTTFRILRKSGAGSPAIFRWPTSLRQRICPALIIWAMCLGDRYRKSTRCRNRARAFARFLATISRLPATAPLCRSRFLTVRYPYNGWTLRARIPVALNHKADRGILALDRASCPCCVSSSIQNGELAPSKAPRVADWHHHNAKLTVRAEELGFDLIFGLAQAPGSEGHGGETAYRTLGLDAGSRGKSSAYTPNHSHLDRTRPVRLASAAPRKDGNDARPHDRRPVGIECRDRISCA